jgi:uncharacterized coiled-coil DUF342 family protein
LDRVKRELKEATAGRDKAMLENERRHNDAIVQMQAQLTQLHKEINEAKAELNEVEATIPKRRAEYDSIIRGLNDLRGRLKIA